MLHHEESPEKRQYETATHPFLENPPQFYLTPLLKKKILDPPPFPSILEKSTSSFYEGESSYVVLLFCLPRY